MVCDCVCAACTGSVCGSCYLPGRRGSSPDTLVFASVLFSRYCAPQRTKMENIFPDIKLDKSLNYYIQSKLRPTLQELNRFHNAIDQFVRFLQQEFSEPPFTVAKVLKSGSLGKGTALRDGSDIDLVVFVNGLHSIDDLREHRENLIERLVETAKAYPPFQNLHFEAREPTKYAAKFALWDIELDVLPAFDALSACHSNPHISWTQPILTTTRCQDCQTPKEGYCCRCQRST